MAERVLAFDYGLCRIGVAIGQTVTGSARPLCILAARDGVPDWSELEKLLKEWEPHRVLVGLPLNMDGTPSEMSQRARRFAGRIHGRFGLPVEMVDERLSSVEHREERGADGADAIDALAAATICEDWLRNHRE